MATYSDAALGIGERIKESRGRASRPEAAALLGVHPNTLANYEHGTRPPGAKFLEALNRVYGVSPSWVLTGESDKYLRPGVPVGLAMLDAIQKGKPFSIEQQRALADDDTFAAYLSGARVPPPEFLEAFAALTEYPLSRLNAAFELCQALGEIEAVAANVAREPAQAEPYQAMTPGRMAQGASSQAAETPDTTMLISRCIIAAEMVTEGKLDRQQQVTLGLDTWGALSKLCGGHDAAARLGAIADADLLNLARFVYNTRAAFSNIKASPRNPWEF